MSKEQEIEKFMTSLDLTREEAEQLWEDDHSDVVLPEVAELEKKAKENCRRYEKSKKKTVTSRERKVDETKKQLFEIIVAALDGIVTDGSFKNEVEYSFNYENDNYTLKFIRHRKSK